MPVNFGFVIISSNQIVSKVKFYNFFIICFALSLIISFGFGTIALKYFPNLPNNPIEKKSFPFQLFTACIVAPLLETYVFQFLLNKLLVKTGLKNIPLLIITQSIIFGFNHFYNWLYIIATIIAGLILNLLYFYCKKSNRNAFGYVTLLHLLNNLVAVLV